MNVCSRRTFLPTSVIILFYSDFPQNLIDVWRPRSSSFSSRLKKAGAKPSNCNFSPIQNGLYRSLLMNYNCVVGNSHGWLEMHDLAFFYSKEASFLKDNDRECVEPKLAEKAMD